MLRRVNGKSLVGSPAHDEAGHRVVATSRSDHVVVVGRAGHDVFLSHGDIISDFSVGARGIALFFLFYPVVSGVQSKRPLAISSEGPYCDS